MHAWRTDAEARTYFRGRVRPHESCAASVLAVHVLAVQAVLAVHVLAVLAVFIDLRRGF